MKSPADMTFLTLRAYYRDFNSDSSGRNWVFPLETEDMRFKRKQSAESDKDSRPINGDVE